MAIREYLSTHHVFTADEFRHAFAGSVTDRNLLTRAVLAGQVDRPKRGLYVSKTGPFSRTGVNPLDLAAKAAEDAVFGFLSALQLHGVLHNVAFRTQLYTAHKVAPFEYAGQAYQPIRQSNPAPLTQGILTPSGHRYPVTTREQTLVDCLSRLGVAGGAENVLRSVGGFRHLDIDALLQIAATHSSSLRARLGWVLEKQAEPWRVSEDSLTELTESLGAGPHYFSSAPKPRDADWVKRWRLYLSHPEKEMAEWLAQ